MVVRGLAGIGTEFGAKTELRLIERSRGRVASPAVPVEFLSEGQVARFGRFAADPSPVELERFFRLDGDAWRLVGSKRRDENRLGFAVQWGTVRMVGAFLGENPTAVPAGVVAFACEQLGIADPSCLGAYAERSKTAYEHQWEIRRECGYREFAAGERDLRTFVAARAWACEDGPRALFDRAVLWLIEHRVLLPGITVLARLVAEVRAREHERVHELLAGAVPEGLADRHEALLVVEGARRSPLDRLRTGPTNLSGRGLAGAFERALEVKGLGAGAVELPKVPPVKVAALARYGLSANAAALRELSERRRAATLLATVRQLETDAVDDALDLFDLLMATKLLAKAERLGAKAKLKTLPGLRRAAVKIAAAVAVLLEIPQTSGGQMISLAQAWEEIERVIPRSQLTEALEQLSELVPDEDGDDDAEWRAELVKRYGSVTGFLGLLAQAPVGAVDSRLPVVAAVRRLPELVGRRRV